MAKKDLSSVQTDLAALADGIPSQRTEPKREEPPPKSETRSKPKAPPTEETIQFSFGLRKTLRKELSRLASDADMTMRAFVLNALKEKGLTVTNEDLLDLRKQKRSDK